MKKICTGLVFVALCLVLYTSCKPAAERSFAGTYSALLPAASTPGRKITLQLNADNTVRMESDYMNNRPIVVEQGSWKLGPDETVIVELAMQYEGTIKEVITFKRDGAYLQSTDHDQNLYGAEGLKLKKQF